MYFKDKVEKKNISLVEIFTPLISLYKYLSKYIDFLLFLSNDYQTCTQVQVMQMQVSPILWNILIGHKYIR